MIRTECFDSKSHDDFNPHSVATDEDVDEALKEAIAATQAKIEDAFRQQIKIVARLKD